MKGGTTYGQDTVHRRAGPPGGVPGFDQLDPRRVSVPRPPRFEATFQAHMAVRRLDETPQTARWFPVYQNCPLPTPEDWLFFILTYLKTYVLQVV